MQRVDGGEDSEKKFDPSGYDKDLVENLERDIVQKNPNIHWYVRYRHLEIFFTKQNIDNRHQ